jgi:hemerythrin superfamily protein
MATSASTKSKPSRQATSDKAQVCPADALQVLEQDHREVEQLFDEYAEMQDDDEGKADLLRKICRALKVHAKIEEEIFYPRARRATRDDDLIDAAIVEHASVRRLIGEIEAIEVGDDLYAVKIRALEEMVRRHLQEEEEELFPELVCAKLNTKAFGLELSRRKRELMAEMGA